MKIPRFNPRGIRPWMIRRPWLARIACLVSLPFLPFIFAVAVMWQNRGDFAEIGQVVRAIFLPWEKRP